jgi:hypothetical protein
MAMGISAEQWNQIRELFGDKSHVSPSPWRGVPYCALATINQDGSPRVTPIGTLFLEEDRRGFYFELYSRHMSQNLDRDPRICVLVVNTSTSFWGRAIMRARFRRPPAVRLMGTVGKKREATATETNALRKSTRPFRFFKGYPFFWGNMGNVREIHFDAFEPVDCGPPTRGVYDCISPSATG